MTSCVFHAQDASRPHESTVVEVASAEIEAEEDIIQFRIEASHFIWRMVRRLVGVLVRVEKARFAERDFAQLLKGVAIRSWMLRPGRRRRPGCFLNSCDTQSRSGRLFQMIWSAAHPRCRPRSMTAHDPESSLLFE